MEALTLAPSDASNCTQASRLEHRRRAEPEFDSGSTPDLPPLQRGAPRSSTVTGRGRARGVRAFGAARAGGIAPRASESRSPVAGSKMVTSTRVARERATTTTAMIRRSSSTLETRSPSTTSTPHPASCRGARNHTRCENSTEERRSFTATPSRSTRNSGHASERTSHSSGPVDSAASGGPNRSSDVMRSPVRPGGRPRAARRAAGSPLRPGRAPTTHSCRRHRVAATQPTRGRR